MSGRDTDPLQGPKLLSIKVKEVLFSLFFFLYFFSFFSSYTKEGLYHCLLFYHCLLCVITGAQGNKNLLICESLWHNNHWVTQQHIRALLINNKEYKRLLYCGFYKSVRETCELNKDFSSRWYAKKKAAYESKLLIQSTIRQIKAWLECIFFLLRLIRAQQTTGFCHCIQNISRGPGASTFCLCFWHKETKLVIYFLFFILLFLILVYKLTIYYLNGLFLNIITEINNLWYSFKVNTKENILFCNYHFTFCLGTFMPCL